MALSEKQKANMIIKRKKILEAAIQLFAEKGFDGARIQEIASAANVSFGSVFTYFENKETLFHAAITEPLQEFSEQVLDFNPAAEDPLNEIKRMITHQLKIFAGAGPFLNLAVFVVAQNRNHKDTFQELDDFHRLLRAKLVELILNGQKKGVLFSNGPQGVAYTYISLLMGLRLSLIEDPASEFWEQLVPYAMQVFGPKQQQ